MGILHFPDPRASLRICSGCRAPFAPLAPNHQLCSRCFRGAAAIRALKRGAQFWRQCMDRGL